MLGVTEPFSAGIGGGGFMVIRTPRGEVTTIDGRETAPAAMRVDSFFEGGGALPFADARWSGLSAGAPGHGGEAGSTRSTATAGTRCARRSRPGIEVARKGFVVDQTFFDQTAPNVDFFNDIPSTAAIYLDPDGTPMTSACAAQPRYGARVRDDRPLRRQGLYCGPIAEAIRGLPEPADRPEREPRLAPGLITKNDIARYRAPERAPTRIGYRGLDVWGMGPPSSGGSTIGEA